MMTLLRYIARRIKHTDWVLVAMVFSLTALGLIMQFSASKYNMKLVQGQAMFALAGFAIMMIVSMVPVKLLYYGALPLFIFSLGANAIAGVFGRVINGARRWIEIGPITFQPSELVKATLIMVLAAAVSKFINEINSSEGVRIRDLRKIIRETGLKGYLGRVKGQIIMLACIAVAAFDVVHLTKDLGTGVIVFGIGFIILFVISPGIKYLGGIALLGIAAGTAYISTQEFRKGRVEAWLNPENYTTDLAFQIRQGLYAIGSGGWFGKGLGKSIQKDVLPEPQTDMIFAVVCEELGIIGGMVIILLYILLIRRLKKIYDQLNDLFGKIIVLGVSAHIALQALLNLAVITNMVPNTGVPLPFISYGGTTLLCLMAETGMVMCVRNFALDMEEKQVYDSQHLIRA